MAKITTKSTVGMGVVIAAIGGVFGLYAFVQPSFAKVSENYLTIQSERERVDMVFKSQDDRMERLEKAQDMYLEYHIKISNDLSKIKGALNLKD